MSRSRERTRTKWVKVKRSGIHQSGLFARRDIRKGQRVIEYTGDKVIKPESERRAFEQLDKAKRTGTGGVYIFTLNDRYDVDGTAAGNIARFANHSCDPNCETDIIDDRIWIIATRDIPKGAEILFNYTFDLESYEDHPCRCGAANCVGFIAGEAYWPQLRKVLKKKEAARRRKSKKSRSRRD